MRGQRSSFASKKVDTLLLAVRYAPDGQKIALARGIERRGVVWSDQKLFDREAVLAQLDAGRRVATGRWAELAGDLEVVAPVRAVRLDGAGPFLTVDGGERGRPAAEAGDVLDLPVF